MTKEKHINPHGGDPITVARALGMNDQVEVALDFSVNVNPIGTPPALSILLARHDTEITRYPEPHANTAAARLAEVHGISSNAVIVGNGSTEVMSWIVQALKPGKAGWPAPTYAGYSEICAASGIPASSTYIMNPRDGFIIDPQKLAASDADMLFICNPNNPTGVLTESDAILALASDNPSKWIVADESFMDFVPEPKQRSLISPDIPTNLIVVKSLTKFFAIPGLRLGMACGHPSTIGRLRRVQLPWTVNGLAQSLAAHIYSDPEYIKSTRNATGKDRDYLIERIENINGYNALPAAANFILVELPATISVSKLQHELLEQGILIRSCQNFEGLGEQYCRLAVRPQEETDALVDAIASIEGTHVSSKPALTPAIMVVGTTSNAGKSVLAAGLCRYFARTGLSVAPFKAQNMSLNSFVTPEGGEMGRAQVVQAQAAGLPPHTDMNPVLLKPMGDAGSQVIVNGQPIGNFPARDYYEKKRDMKNAAHRAYDRLAGKHDLVVLEGAGSPTEINLMAEDFDNMAMAEHAGAKVILVADIDRGGVFATIYGTIQLLSPHYRKLMSGIIINKFRGDVTMLHSGIKQIEQLTGVPVLGVLPYIRNLKIDDEDSLGLDDRKQADDAILNITVIRLPRISNYTDFVAFENTDGVNVNYIDTVEGLGKPDLLIIPGTKNTRADMRFLRETGLADAILELNKAEIPLVGICGGYQLFGTDIADPTGVEGEAGTELGLSLLPISTVLEPRKQLAQVTGATTDTCPFAESGTPFHGYEIHTGITQSSEAGAPLVITEQGGSAVSIPCGALSDNGLIFGCYVHGFFDAPPVRTGLLNWLCERKGIEPLTWKSSDGMDSEFDRLVDLLDKHIDMNRIDRWSRSRARGVSP